MRDKITGKMFYLKAFKKITLISACCNFQNRYLRPSLIYFHAVKLVNLISDFKMLFFGFDYYNVLK